MVSFVDDQALGLSLGAAEWVPKPIEWDELRRVMDRFREDDGEALIVDDDPGHRQRLRATLERNGWSVAEAENGRAALDIVAHRPPRVILLDLTMPVMDGFSFLHELRQSSGLRVDPGRGSDRTRSIRRGQRAARRVRSRAEQGRYEFT